MQSKEESDGRDTGLRTAELVDRIEDIMVKKVVTIDPDASLAKAAKLMIKNRVGSIVILKKERVVGIISESSCKTFSARADPPLFHIQVTVKTSDWLGDASLTSFRSSPPQVMLSDSSHKAMARCSPSLSVLELPSIASEAASSTS